MTPKRRIQIALINALRYGQIDGDHHKAWVIDQMVRALCGGIAEYENGDDLTEYNEWVKNACAGDDGPDTYEWDVGIAP